MIPHPVDGRKGRGGNCSARGKENEILGGDGHAVGRGRRLRVVHVDPVAVAVRHAHHARRQLAVFRHLLQLEVPQGGQKGQSLLIQFY